jgi:uncharacterized protein (DUF305 family)
MNVFSPTKETVIAVAMAAIVAVSGAVLYRHSGVLTAAGVSSECQAIASVRPVDIGFAQHMALHHDQAVVMAKIVRGRASGRINLLAEGIETDQMMEIGELKGWLKLWGAPLLPTASSMDWMFKNPKASWNVSPAYLDLCRSSSGGMPGLATLDELNGLRRASGAELDVLFLRLMLRHHQGAIPMSKYAAKNAETELVGSTAARMVYEQRKEIEAMRVMLKDMGGEPLPFLDEEEM